MSEKQKASRLSSELLNLAGEYRVCSELTKRRVFATVTYGNRKGVDVYAISDSRRLALRIEVKTSQLEKFVTGISQKGLAEAPDAPDFWVLVQIRRTGDDEFVERFFVLTHKEICSTQDRRNRIYATKYERRHGKQPDFSKGVDQVKLEDVFEHENKWSKIVGLCTPGLATAN